MPSTFTSLYNRTLYTIYSIACLWHKKTSLLTRHAITLLCIIKFIYTYWNTTLSSSLYPSIFFFCKFIEKFIFSSSSLKTFKNSFNYAFTIRKKAFAPVNTLIESLVFCFSLSSLHLICKKQKVQNWLFSGAIRECPLDSFYFFVYI